MHPPITMRPFFLSILLTISTLCAAADTSRYQQAIESYQKAEYQTTIELLTEEIRTQKEQGRESATLYYNLGNAFYRTGNLPQAILNYERAAILAPNNSKIRQNIEFVNSKLENPIIKNGSFYLMDKISVTQNILTSNQWAQLGIAGYILLIISIISILVGKKRFKNIALYLAVITLPLILTFNFFSYKQKQKIVDRNTAIVTSYKIPLTTSPSSTSQILFELYAGTKLHIRQQSDGWVLVEAENGNKGWVRTELITII